MVKGRLNGASMTQYKSQVPHTPPFSTKANPTTDPSTPPITPPFSQSPPPLTHPIQDPVVAVGRLGWHLHDPM